MARTTRAALRSRELIEEESAAAASVPLPLTPQRQRVPLGEISDNQGATESTIVTIPFNEPVKPGRKGKQAKGKGKANKKQQAPDVEILDDGNQSSASSAVEETRQNLTEVKAEEPDSIVSGEKGDDVSMSPAARLASESLSPVSTYELEDPKMDRPDKYTEKPEVHDQKAQDEQPNPPIAMDESSNIDSKSDDKDSEDSFVKQIKSRSPVKRVSRIEDSVEALDALEDAIEKAAEAIPAANKLAKSGSGDKKVMKSRPRPSVGLKSEKNPTKVQPKPRVPHQKENRPTRTTNKNGSPTLSATPKVAVKTRTPVAPALSKQREVASNASAGKDQALNTKVAPSKRVSSIHKAPFQPTKSTKPPTRSSFELPGEAISRTLKEQREERQKRELEEKGKTNTFKARPVPKNQAPEVKMTATAKARLSISRHEPFNNLSPAKSVIRTKAGQGTVNGANTGPDKRLSSLTLPKRGSVDPKPDMTTTTAKRVSSINPNFRRSSTATAIVRKAPTPEDIAQQKEKGKAVFARPKDEIAERERERKEREEAAKKARMEAAERGRLASRQWAEKQKEKGRGRVPTDKVSS